MLKNDDFHFCTQASVLSAIKKDVSVRNVRETKYIVEWLQSVEFLHNLNNEVSLCKDDDC